MIEILLCIVLILSPESPESWISDHYTYYKFQHCDSWCQRCLLFHHVRDGNSSIVFDGDSYGCGRHVWIYTGYVYVVMVWKILDAYGYEADKYKKIFVLMLIFACLAVGVCFLMKNTRKQHLCLGLSGGSSF